MKSAAKLLRLLLGVPFLIVGGLAMLGGIFLVAFSMIIKGAYPLAPRNTKYRLAGWGESSESSGFSGTARARFQRSNGCGDYSPLERPE